MLDFVVTVETTFEREFIVKGVGMTHDEAINIIRRKLEQDPDAPASWKGDYKHIVKSAEVIDP